MPLADIPLEPIAPWAFSTLLVVGTVAFAISGAVAAMRVGMDVVGVTALAALTAVGGGSLRDIVVGNLPMWWIAQWWALFLAVGIALVLVPLRHRFGHLGSPDSWQTVVVADALGLAAFVATGASLILRLGFPAWLAVLLGVLTGVGGGLLRDVLANTKPLVLTGQVYASAALGGSLVFVLLWEVGWLNAATYWIPVVIVIAIRLIAIRRRWQFPALQIQG